MKRSALLASSLIFMCAHFLLSGLPPSQSSPLLVLDRLFDVGLGSALATILDDHSDWHRVYIDDGAVIFSEAER